MNTHIIRKLVAVALVSIAGMAGSLSALAADQDDQIEKTFKNSEAYQTQLKSADVSIDSENGIVTLKGEIDNEKQRNIALETARDIPGVQRVNDEMRIAKQPSDERIATEVRGALLLHKNVSLIHTKVSSNEGVVTLTGSAESEAEKSLAARYAADVRGVKRVVNNIQVEPDKNRSSASASDRSMGEKIDDGAITAKIKYALGAERATSALRTEVTTENGVVTVRGEAKNSAEKDLVTKLAKSVEGVRDVHNEMVISRSMAGSD
ncbi:MAG: BON domain-containing protein [Nibricoccus sp.]